MRRYGNTGYGGYSNVYPPKTQPEAFRGTLHPVARRHTPPDIVPRRPTAPMQMPPLEPMPPGGVFDPEAFLDALMQRINTGFHPYNAFDALRYASFKTLPLFINTMDVVVLEQATDIRVYLFIVNTHPINDIFLTFQTPATPLTGVPISPSRGFYEFIAPVPQDAIHLIASAAGTTGVLVYAERDPTVLNRQPGPL